MTRLDGKVALVTGAGQGIGRAIADLFARNGGVVIATDVHASVEPDQHVAAYLPLDVTSEKAWNNAVRIVTEDHGRIDVLINNAGIATHETVEDVSVSAWNRVMDVSATGTMLGMRAVIPIMRAVGGGSIVNFSSIWGSAAVPFAAAYHAAKGAVRNLSKNAAITYAKDGIRVNSVHPGFIDTPATRAQGGAVNSRIIGATPLGRAGTVLEVAYGCLFLASDEASFVTGSELVIDGGYLGQ